MGLWITPAVNEALFVKVDGTVPLTGNWNTGAFNVTYTKTGATANTYYDGFIATNTSTASLGNQMHGGFFHSVGNGWATTPSASRSVDCRWGNVPVQGAANPSGSFLIDFSINGGAFTRALTVASGGTVTALGSLVAGSGLVAPGNLTLNTAGGKIVITEGTNGSVGQTTLVSGTKAITITGVTTSTRAFITLVTPTGTTLTTTYQAVCTANTLTIQANIAAGTINTADGSVLNYFTIN